MALLPKVKLKAVVSFPATVLDGAGIDVVKANGNFTFNFAFGDFAPPVSSCGSDAPECIWSGITSRVPMCWCRRQYCSTEPYQATRCRSWTVLRSQYSDDLLSEVSRPSVRQRQPQSSTTVRQSYADIGRGSDVHQRGGRNHRLLDALRRRYHSAV